MCEEAPPFRSLIQRYTKAELETFLHSLDDKDAWLIRMSGDDPADFVEKLKSHRLIDVWRRRRSIVAFWSLDNHHQGMSESRSSYEFDYSFLAHSEFIDNHEFNNPVHLPVAHNLGRWMDVESIWRDFSPAQTWDVSLPFVLYPGSARNEVALFLMKLADDRKLSTFVGRVNHTGEDPQVGYIQHLLGAQVVVSPSLKGDLNMRVVEALALGRNLVMDRGIADLPTLGPSRAVVAEFQRGSYQSFANAIDTALSAPVTPLDPNFFQRNSVEARLCQALAVMFDESDLVVTGLNNIRKNQSLLESSGHKQHFLHHSYQAGDVAVNLPFRLLIKNASWLQGLGVFRPSFFIKWGSQFIKHYLWSKSNQHMLAHRLLAVSRRLIRYSARLRV